MDLLRYAGCICHPSC
ncbi:hypothetical protein ACFWFF_03585 [Streptomyces sp. NPDC060223]